MKIKEFFQKRYSRKVSLDVRFYYIGCVLAMVIGALLIAVALIVMPKLWITVAMITAGCILIVLGFWALYHKVRYLYQFITIMIYNLIIFPTIFYVSGGLPGGAGVLFILGLFLIVMYIKRSQAWVTGIFMVIYFIACVSLSIKYPNNADIRENANMLWDNLGYFIFSSIIIFTMSKLLVDGYNYQHNILVNQNAQLNIDLITDDLTSIYNHRHIVNEIVSTVTESEKYTEIYLLMIDIDNFKEINDEYGHMVGNDVLLDLAKIMVDTVAERGVCARYGGEEFMVLFRNMSKEQVFDIAESIRKKCEDSLSVKGTDRHITVSIGIAKYDKSMNAEDFGKAVDSRMYKAKNTGKNRTVME